ncbi:right-handed parallel beta-helix repeat-containing protein [Streptomyces sp. NPDC048442]|uniref:right-handed parallel beta-helix repeat-containing protein n=1 Tax=Streptomyces sp. NPDC048442 TaxID=3154823 RepID=UPI0034434E61
MSTPAPRRRVPHRPTPRAATFLLALATAVLPTATAATAATTATVATTATATPATTTETRPRPTTTETRPRPTTTHYLDCTSGNDTSNGTSVRTPWRTLAKASTAYRPGDRLLLKRGTTCTGTLAPTGNGTPTSPIRLDAYGTGAKPHIEGAGARAALLLRNSQGWEIRNLDLSNTGPAPTPEQRRAGLLVLLTDFGVGRHYVVGHVDVHDVNGSDHKDPDPSGGILFVVQGDRTPTRFDGIRIEDSTVKHVDRTGIGTMSTWGRRTAYPDGPGTSFEPLTGVRIQRNDVRDVGGDAIVTHNADGARVEHNYVNGFNMRSAGYNAGVWSWNSDNVLTQYNEVTGGHGTRDSEAFDIDGGNTDNVFQYNYSHDNEGGFLLVCNGAGMTSKGNKVRHNISINDRNTEAPYGVVAVVCGPTTDTQVHHNTIVTKHPHTRMVSNNGQTGTTFRNNVFVGAPTPTGSPTVDTLSTFSGNLYLNTAQPRDPYAVNADPLFSVPAPATPGDVRLKPGSPARGAGTPEADGVTRDYFGNRIPNPPHLGAYQGR